MTVLFRSRRYISQVLLYTSRWIHWNIFGTFLLMAALLLSSCGGAATLKPAVAPEVIRVEQIYPRKRLLVELKDPSQIQRVISFVNARPNTWTVPLAGPPVGKVYLVLLTNNRVQGNFYAGPLFFGRDQGNFWSQSATEDEIAELGQLVGVPLVEIINAQ